MIGVFLIATSLLAATATVTATVYWLRWRAAELSYREMLSAVPPAVGQMWQQDGGTTLHIVRVDHQGILWSAQHPLVDGYRPQESARLDSWTDWRVRLSRRNLVLLPARWQ